MARAARIVVVVALVAAALGPGRPAVAGPSGWCTFDDKTGIVRIGGASQMAVGATKEGVLRWGEAPAWNPNWFAFTTCNGGGKFVTLDVVERIDITASAVSTTRGDDHWVFVFDEAFGDTGPDQGAPASGLAHERISVMGPSSLRLSASLGPDQPVVTVRPGGVDRDGDGKLDLTYITKPADLELLLGDVPGGVTFDASTFDLPILRVHGGDGGDLITGSDQDDRLNGGPGNDIVVGRKGDDVVWGEWGLDQLDGSEGDDEVVGWVDTDPDLVLGGPDNDTCRLGPNDPQPIGCEQIT